MYLLVWDALSSILDLLTRPEFRAGVLAGVAGYAVILLLVRVDRTRQPPWAIIGAVAVLAALDLTSELSYAFLAGLGFLSLGGWMLDNGSESTVPVIGAWGVLLLGGGIVGFLSGLPNSTWMMLGVPAVGLLGGQALLSWRQSSNANLVGPLWAITCFGVWIVVPDTEAARALLGVSLPLAVATTRPVSARIAGIGSFTMATILAWVVATGGFTRPASLIGGWACMGLLVLFPYLIRPPLNQTKFRPFFLVAAHLIVVLAAARVIGQWESGLWAAVALVFIVAIVGVGVLASPRHRSTDLDPGIALGSGQSGFDHGE